MCPAHNVSEAVLEVLLPVVKEIKKDVNSVKRELTSLNETVSNLSGDLEQHKKGVESTSDLMRGDLKSVKKKLRHLDKSVSHLSGDLEQHKNQTTSVLADLQSSINRSSERLRDTLVNQLNDLDSKLNTTSELMRGDLRSVKRELTSLNESVNRICDKMGEHEDHMTTETQQQNLTCNGIGGWRRAVYLDMTDPNTNCPEGWRMTDYSKRTCGRTTDGNPTCDSVTFPVSGGEYSQVCGRIRAYQWGWTAGFSGSYRGHTSVNEAYFTGVAVMHGYPRQHIWTFAAGGAENFHNPYSPGLCPCDGAPTNLQYIPPFVGENYFCESGYIYPGQWIYNEVQQPHFNDTLWDGRDCHSNSTCCSLHNPPYFTKTLNTPTTNDIELRMCNYNKGSLGHIEVELVELYIK